MARALARGALLWRVAPVAWMLLLFLLSSQGDFGEPLALPDWLPIDKLVHAALYGVLAALLYQAGLGPFAAVAVAGLYGVTDEFHQMFVPGRFPDLFDWLADVTGAALGVWLVRFPSRMSEAGRKPLE